VVWHDFERQHERRLALRYFGHCRIEGEGRIGWCRWEQPGPSATLRRLTNILRRPRLVLP
jgi:hypothetical protein